MSLVSTYPIAIGFGKETWVPNMLILDISQVGFVQISYHYNFTNDEIADVSNKESPIVVELGIFSKRIMNIFVDLSKVSESISSSIVEEIKKLKVVNDFTGFNPNHEIVYQETLKVFSNG